MTRTKAMLAGAAAAAILAAAAPAAFAHAAYKSSNPADESTVASPPSQITAEFTEPLTEASSMLVYDPCGQQVDNGDSNPSGYNMSVSMSGDKAGTYTVEFKAQSSLDSHTTTGSFTFTSSDGDPCPGAEPPPAGGSGGGPKNPPGGDDDPDPGSDSPGAAQDPTTPASSGGTTRPAATGGGDDRPAAKDDARQDPKGRGPRRNDNAGSPGGAQDPVAFEPTGTTAPVEQPAPWDLPLSGVVLALGLCVMIGAAGGRVYAGIVAPRR